MLFGDWTLEFPWDLVFGIYNSGFALCHSVLCS